MDKLILTIGAILSLSSILLLNRLKSKFNDEQLIDFEKNIRPKFYIYYLISLTPLLLFAVGLMLINLEILYYFVYILSLSLVLDGLAIYKLNKLVSSSKFSKDYNKTQILIILILISKTIMLFGLKSYIETALNMPSP